MGEEKVDVGPRKWWGTWEELILGAAVLRHGTREWDVVSSELRVRTIYPSSFTPEACKAKYEELRQRYSGCTAWFEELRKRRVAELKLELEKSEASIGLLVSKLESLKAAKGNYCQVDYDTSQTQSPALVPKTEVNEYFGKEASKDGLSAGSFTQDSRSNWLPECCVLAVASTPEMETKSKASDGEQGKFPSEKVEETRNEQGGTIRKRRGKRKRKDCNLEAREGSIGESDNLGSANVLNASSCKETSTSGCGQTVRSSSADGRNGYLFSGPSDDLVGILNFIAESKHALGFRRRLDSQKRARYKKIIRQHMDFDTIRSRISIGYIKSTRELFRDLLLLANNALVFYSKRTREYKSALALRDLVMKEYREHCKDSSNKASSSILFLSQMCNPPVKPRSTRPRTCRPKFSAKLNNAQNDVAGSLLGSKRGGDVDNSTHSLQSLLKAKKSSGAPQGYLKLKNANSNSPLPQSLPMPEKHSPAPQGCKKPKVVDSKLPLQAIVMAKRDSRKPRKGGRGAANCQPKTSIVKERKRSQQKVGIL